MASMASDLRLALDADHFARSAGLEGELDPWQRQVLDAVESKIILNCSRQSGKSTTAALLACRSSIYQPGSLILCVSPSLRQSGELFQEGACLLPRFAAEAGDQGGVGIAAGAGEHSRVISLPGSEKTTRGYSKASLIILDEASRIEDALISSLRPMMATARGGRFVVMSTPFGKRGFFHDRWHAKDPGWLKIEIPAERCPRIPADFLSEQERELGPLLYRQEYCCEFVDDAETLFSSEIVEKAFDAGIRPLFAAAA